MTADRHLDESSSTLPDGGYNRTCDCKITYTSYDYKKLEGCIISKAAGRACKCQKSVSLDRVSGQSVPICTGQLVFCDNTVSSCKSPGKDLDSCLLGRGNCDGYRADLSPTASCDCELKEHGGCFINKPAPPGYACKCKLQGRGTSKDSAWCAGFIVPCEIYADACRNPGTDVASCYVIKDGSCGGHGWNPGKGCDCDHHQGGCRISEAAPPGTSCMCAYSGFWYCKGHVTRCVDQGHPLCNKPDKSRESCFNAPEDGGTGRPDRDCGGY